MNAEPNHRSGFVVLGGRSNVGKSTLVNRIVGHKVAIVTPKPQTTRRKVMGIRSDPDAQIIFIDTPGIHDSPKMLNRRMVQTIRASVEFHRHHGKLATVTAVVPPGRYGALERSGDRVTGFIEKPRGDGGLINGGFFVLSPKCLDLIEGDDSSWEITPLTRLAAMGQMMAFEHHGFWQPMDTLRDKNLLEELWVSGQAPWKIWQ